MFAQAVGAYLYRAVASEHEIMSAMAAASRMGESQILDQLGNHNAHQALDLLNGVDCQQKHVPSYRDQSKILPVQLQWSTFKCFSTTNPEPTVIFISGTTGK